ncbi:NAD-dependent epimerase/dehydratase family protein [Streptomyces piniterrae]|uniref:NAD-dependent epimerase/dehydratase family protein n=1 Tax=Streptomyces piniterrae TaxID=2571125 RepID=A0A4U0NF15_9ACTN|nr:NAD-dependent epimerase/dehydratase family protein [Streptomyces piniterrae]TJZ52152.1 NAD-dependent epimerase/dehydratase family protein [Streptomyces piniterrae]
MTAPAARPLVVVLGASGYLGTAVTRELAARDIRLRLVSRRPAGVPEGARAVIEEFGADLTDRARLAAAVEGADVVVHLVARIAGATSWRGAAADPAIERVNVGLVHDLVDVLRENAVPGRRPAVLFAGTVASVGVPGKVRIDGSEPDDPRSAYPRQKLAAERALKAAGEEGLLRAVSLRMPTIFGPGPKDTAAERGVVVTMIRRALQGSRLELWDRTVRREMIHVTDVARAFAAALDHVDALAGRHWLIGTGRSEPLGDMFTAIAAAVADHTGAEPVPVVEVPPPAEAEATDLQGMEVDASAFTRITGWHPVAERSVALPALVAEVAARAVPSRVRTGNPMTANAGRPGR